MAEMEKVEFEFPDEVEAKGKEEAAPPAEELEAKNTPEIEIEVEDDTPPEDRGRQPLPKEVVQKLEIEVNELDQYSEDAKKKMIQMKKVWNDERRRADAADRERQEALEATRRLHEENKRMKELLSNGEKEYLAAMKTAADLQLEMAKKSYKDAYEAGDSEGMMNAQQSITNATLQLDRVKNFKMPALQEEKNEVQIQPRQTQAVQPDEKSLRWQARNQWFGAPGFEEVTSYALGLHQKLVNGGIDPRNDEYFEQIDARVKSKFPEVFGGAEDKNRTTEAKKPSTVVAPAGRSTGVKKVQLTPTQAALVQKFKLDPKKYYAEVQKLEKQNG